MSRRTFAFFLATSNVGGTEMAVLKLLSHYDYKDTEWLALTLTPPGALHYQCASNGLKIESLQYSGIHDLFKSLVLLRKVIRAHNIVGVYAFGMIPHVLALFWKFFGVLKFVISGQRGDLREGIVGLFLRRLLANYCECIVFNSSSVCMKAVSKYGFEKSKSLVIRNGVNILIPSTQNLSSKLTWQKMVRDFNLQDVASEHVRYLVGTVANLRKEKDYPTFIKAASIVVKHRKDVRFISIGEGALRQILYDLVIELDLSKYFYFLGYQENPLELVNALNVFVLSSVTESSPNSIIEAMSLEKPVIATSVGGIPEVVVDRESGILIEPGDFQTLAACILDLLERPDVCSDLGRRGRERVILQYDLTQAMLRTKELVDSFIED
jgi:glycosyltransferase involved in cell wall biosynthesis